MADLSLVLGINKSGIPQITDLKTGAVVSGAVFSNLVAQPSSNPEFATFAVGSDGATFIATPVAAGSGTVSLQADVDYTDAGDGSTQHQTLTITKAFTVAQAADGVSFDVVFS